MHHDPTLSLVYLRAEGLEVEDSKEFRRYGTRTTGSPRSDMEEWETSVDPHFDKVVEYLRPTLLMDKLRAKDLITKSEYIKLQLLGTETERSRILVNEYLRTKGPGSLHDFCVVLRELYHRGHEYVADLIEGRAVSRDNPVTTAGSEAQFTAQPEMAAEQPEMAAAQPEMAAAQAEMAVGSSSKVTARKRKILSPATRRPDVPTSPRTATFFFKPEHHAIIEAGLGSLIKSLCQNYLNIESDKVLFGYGDVSAYLKMLGYPFFSDTDIKQGVLLVSGLSPAQVLKYKDNIEQSIIGTFRLVDPTLPRGACLILEILPNCSFIVLQLSTPAVLALLRILGDEQRSARLKKSLGRALPGSRNVLLRLGGLPPLELLSNSTVMPASARVKQGDYPCFCFSICSMS